VLSTQPPIHHIHLSQQKKLNKVLLLPVYWHASTLKFGKNKSIHFQTQARYMVCKNTLFGCTFEHWNRVSDAKTRSPECIYMNLQSARVEWGVANPDESHLSKSWWITPSNNVNQANLSNSTSSSLFTCLVSCRVHVAGIFTNHSLFTTSICCNTWNRCKFQFIRSCELQEVKPVSSKVSRKLLTRDRPRLLLWLTEKTS